MSENLTCPYCNALLPAERAAECPRCGETLPAPASLRGDAVPPGVAVRPRVDTPPSPSGRGLLWLTLAAVVVAAGWAGWRWMDRVRARGPGPPPDEPPGVGKAADIPRLRHLPAAPSANLAGPLPAVLD